MVNLSIIVTISKYNVGSGFSNLIGVDNDNKYFTNIIENSHKYTQVINIKEKCKSSGLRSRLDELVTNYNKTEVNELLIYFSGHGYLADEDFYLCCSDSEISNISSTAISSREIDDIARKLKVKKYVKIIDACNSGTSYIKGSKLQNMQYDIYDPPEFLKDCYFLCSCDEKQESRIDQESKVSKFTLSIINSIHNHFITKKEKTLPYIVLQAKVEEFFKDDIYQTPKMTHQGETAYAFLERNEDLINYLKSIKEKITYKENVKKETKIVTEIEAINYSEKFINSLETYISNKKYQGNVISKMNYKVNKEYIVPYEVHESKKIGEWIANNRNQRYIFAEPHYVEKYTGSPFSQLADSISGNSKNYVTELTSFKLNVNEEKSCLNFSLISENEGLPKFSVQVVLMFNINKLYVLYNFLYAFPKNWKEYNDYVSNNKVGILSLKLLSNDLDKSVKQLATEISDYTNSILNKYISELELEE